TTRRATPAEQLGSVCMRIGAGFAKRGGWTASSKRARQWRRAAATVQDARGTDPWVRDERLARMEAVLFLARQPLATRKLAQLAHLADGTEARTLIRRLNRGYDELGSAFRAEEVAGGYQLLSRAQFGPWLRRFFQTTRDVRLSAPALETLAVVAYRQPVMRAEV